MSNVPSAAVDVLNSFLNASQRKDVDAMKACLNRASLESGQFDGSGPEGMRVVIGDAQMEDAVAVVPMKAFPLDGPADSPPAMEMTCLMVQEDGQWKFDLVSTMQRMMGGQMEAAMQQVADGLGEVMSGVGEALSDAMGGSTPAGEDDPSWDQASLTPQPDELFALPELFTLPATSKAVSDALQTKVPVEAALADLLKQLGSDQRDQLIGWFDGTLFASWGTSFAGASSLPLANRLRSVRIETAYRCEDRIIVLDGSDLVYRMNLNHTDGYFSDDYIAALLPGVLAGLPDAIDPAVAGHRTLPLDSEYPTVESYRERHVPRWMRRVRTLMGKPIRLEVDWRSAADATNAGPQLPRWGLNRVYGALALACTDAAKKEELVRDLKTIELDVGSGASSRAAKYEDGKLTVSVCYYGHDTPGCYEHEIAGALAGVPF